MSDGEVILDEFGGRRPVSSQDQPNTTNVAQTPQMKSVKGRVYQILEPLTVVVHESTRTFCPTGCIVSCVRVIGGVNFWELLLKQKLYTGAEGLSR
jgi:energy-converting hydrogenase Eha subunit F